jgi:hypothetical protein
LAIAITIFSDDDKSLWDEFVWKANNGTIFQTRQFLSYHPHGRFVDHSLSFYKERKRIAVFPAVNFIENGKRILLSHRGASYGGLIVKDTLSIRDSFELVAALTDHAKQAGFDAIDLTPPPQIYLKRPSNYIDFALKQSGFYYRKREISSVIPLDFRREEILSTFSESSRRAVRKALKSGTFVRESDDYACFYRILKKNLHLRHNVTPTHSLDELLHLVKIFPDRIKLFAAYHRQSMVAGVVMFICNPRVVLAFYISHDEAMQQYRGVNLLFHDICDWGIREGYNFLDFGIFTVNEDPNWGLARFKESFGAQGVFRDSWRIEF